MSEVPNVQQSVEFHLNNLANYLLSLSYKCKMMACYFRKNYSDMFGIADFYQWCADDMDKSVDLVKDYIGKIGCHVEIKEAEKPEREDFGTPLKSLQYILKEDQCLSALLTNIYNYSKIKGEENLKNFLEEEMIIPQSAWNKKIQDLIEKLRLANETQNQTDLDKTFKNEFSLIKRLRDQKLI
ncbi:unnamed protein product [Brachionus calyciflorus]|uniref:Ferritin n=1 Tax=Brachionus calyciflorus TaxID=104777 RepID=A0A813ML73_9BILA|nr:unnamed protein product [Brachionus calyciflorus]